ncbi:hypothetical protein niasHT_018612 [Heterodera trifolii]|uniref:RING-type domain-containing protein n=1 Tax=Heterodera trifolii TaxID=157864 RepID=A0ABD2L119_9BILA
MIGKINWIFLLLLATLWPSAECHVKVLADSDKVPKNSIKISTNHGKMSTQMADGKSVYSLFQEYGQKILGKNNKHNEEQLKTVIEGLNKKQCLLEEVFYPQNLKKNIYLNEKEFKFFKNQWEEIYQNDPALSQLLEGLFAVIVKANEAMKTENTNKLSTRKNELKQSLAYAVFFMAKRGKISLESPRGKKENKPKAILIELIDIYNELQLDIEKTVKSWQKGKEEKEQKGKKENEQKGERENKQKERRFFQFVARSLEIEWDANAFCTNGQNDNDDDDERLAQKIVLIIFGIALVVLIFCKYNSFHQLLSRPHANGVASVPKKQTQSAAFTAFKTLTSIPYEANANEEENSCAICLDPIENGTMVKPLPCKHIFHNKCIYSWIKQHITCPMCRDALSMKKAVGVSSNGQANGATNGNGGGSAQGTAAVANPQDVVIDIPSDGQNGGNTVGTGTDGAEPNRHNNGTANGPN